MSIIVGRHINGITLNELEFLLDESGNEMEFNNENEAIDFLKEKGATDEDIYYFRFIDTAIENRALDK